MSRSKTKSRKRRSKGQTLAEVPFRRLIQQDIELKNLRVKYASVSAEERRQAAQWAVDSSHASTLLAEIANTPDWVHPAWDDAAAPLAIDPEYAPAMLTVGSLEYQYGRVEEAMTLFLKLTTLPAETEDIQEIVDKAGDFLIDQDDYINADRLYDAAVRTYPEVALYHVGLAYCRAELGRMDESVAHHQRAVEFEPGSYLHLNDLGYSLLEAGRYDEAEEVLQRAVRLAPPDYDLAKGNLEHLRKVRSDMT